MSALRQTRLAELRAEIAALERALPAPGEVLPFGEPRVDERLPGGGLGLGRWHEFVGEGLELETGAASAAFIARLAAPLAAEGELVWVLRRNDLHAPGLVGLGFPADRLIQVCARDAAEVLAVMEDALRTPGVAAAVGEAEGVDLVAGRRLQLACEEGRGTGFVLRRRPFGGGGRADEAGSAAASRWLIAPSPSESAPGAPGLGAPRWRVTLERSRGGRCGAWILEAREEHDAPHPFRLVAELADHDVAAQTPLRLVG
jgi:protein ImuA